MTNSEDIETILTIIAMFIIIPVTIIGNFLTVYATIRFPYLQTQTYILIANLAVSDLLLGLLAVPLRLAQLFGSNWSNNETHCKISISFTLMFCNGSVLNLTLLTLDRVFSIAFPMTYSDTQKQKYLTSIGIPLMWLLSILIAFMPYIGWGSVSSSSVNSTVDICRYLAVLDQNFVIMVFAATVFLPLMVMLVSYIYIFQISRHHLMKIISLENGVYMRQELSSLEQDAAKTGI